MKSLEMKKRRISDAPGNIYSIDIYYHRNNYELAYKLSKLENGEVVVIVMAGTRQNFYQKVKRYIK